MNHFLRLHRPYNIFYPLILCFIQTGIYLFLLHQYSLIRNIDNQYFALDKIPGAFFSPTIILTLLGFIFLTVIYYLHYRIIIDNCFPPSVITIIFITSISCLLISVFIYPIGALDLFNYIAESKQFFFYHLNPYVIPFSLNSVDPLNNYAIFLNIPLVYGPAWLFSTFIPNLFSKNILNLVIAYKLFNVFILLSTGYFIFRLSNKSTKLISTFLFIANPYVIFEAIVNGHNDILMAFFILLFCLYLNKNKVLSITFFSLSVLTKFYSLVLAPIILINIIIKKWSINNVVRIVCTNLFIITIFLIPFWNHGHLIKDFLVSFQAAQQINTYSVFSLIRELISNYSLPSQWISYVWLILFLVFIGLLAWQIVRFIRSQICFNTAIIYSLLFFIVLLSSAQPWYFIPIIGLLCLEPSNVNKLFVFTLTLGLLVSYPASVWAWFNSDLSEVHIHQFLSLFIYLPFIIYLIHQSSTHYFSNNEPNKKS
jgi:hypothetical protein